MLTDTIQQPLCSRPWLGFLWLVAIVAIPIAIAFPKLAIAANSPLSDNLVTAMSWQSRTEESEDCEWLGLCD